MEQRIEDALQAAAPAAALVAGQRFKPQPIEGVVERRLVHRNGDHLETRLETPLVLPLAFTFALGAALEFSDKDHSYKYRIIESPLPLQDYVSSISLAPGKGGGTTVVTWVGNFKRKNPADNPPEAESDAGAVKLITGVYRAGLENLKTKLEGLK